MVKSDEALPLFYTEDFLVNKKGKLVFQTHLPSCLYEIVLCE